MDSVLRILDPGVPFRIKWIPVILQSNISLIPESGIPFFWWNSNYVLTPADWRLLFIIKKGTYINYADNVMTQYCHHGRQDWCLFDKSVCFVRAYFICLYFAGVLVLSTAWTCGCARVDEVCTRRQCSICAFYSQTTQHPSQYYSRIVITHFVSEMNG